MALQDELRKLVESVESNFSPEEVAIRRENIKNIVDLKIAEGALNSGDMIPDFNLPDVHGKTIKVKDLLKKGPLVISFYRGSWCTLCNLELRALQQRLTDIHALGAELLAISPERPDGAMTLVEKHALTFPVLSDLGNEVARSFGLVFNLTPAAKQFYAKYGYDFAKINADGNYELPIPGTFIVDRSGKINLAYVEADYEYRLDPDLIVKALEDLK